MKIRNEVTLAPTKKLNETKMQSITVKPLGTTHVKEISGDGEDKIDITNGKSPSPRGEDGDLIGLLPNVNAKLPEEETSVRLSEWQQDHHSVLPRRVFLWQCFVWIFFPILDVVMDVTVLLIAVNYPRCILTDFLLTYLSIAVGLGVLFWIFVAIWVVRWLDARDDFTRMQSRSEQFQLMMSQNKRDFDEAITWRTIAAIMECIEIYVAVEASAVLLYYENIDGARTLGVVNGMKGVFLSLLVFWRGTKPIVDDIRRKLRKGLGCGCIGLVMLQVFLVALFIYMFAGMIFYVYRFVADIRISGDWGCST